MAKCPKCGAGEDASEGTFACGTRRGVNATVKVSNQCLRRQLAAANERANTYLGEMVRLQEAIDGANERAGRLENELAERAKDIMFFSELHDSAVEALAAANERAGRLEEERGQLREAWSIINSEAIDEYAETLTHIVAARAMLNAALVEVPDAM